MDEKDFRRLAPWDAINLWHRARRRFIGGLGPIKALSTRKLRDFIDQIRREYQAYEDWLAEPPTKQGKLIGRPEKALLCDDTLEWWLGVEGRHRTRRTREIVQDIRLALHALKALEQVLDDLDERQKVRGRAADGIENLFYSGEVVGIVELAFVSFAPLVSLPNRSPVRIALEDSTTRSRKQAAKTETQQQATAAALASDPLLARAVALHASGLNMSKSAEQVAVEQGLDPETPAGRRLVNRLRKQLAKSPFRPTL
jgi:hypothetical protein